MRPLNITISDAAARKAADRQQGADRHADDAGDQRRGEADAQTEPDNAGEPARRLPETSCQAVTRFVEFHEAICAACFM
jgi:hypothetical protein